jgi:hypothetical protein
MSLRAATGIGCMLLTGCAGLPESFPPPPQRQPALSSKIPLQMSDPETDAPIVQDIPKNEKGPWRWAGPKPTVRILLTSVADTRLFVEYSVADATFKDTGPVKFRFLVNGQLVDEIRHTKPGAFTLDKPVPAAMLKPNAGNEIAVEVDKPWVAPQDGAKLGFILTSIGFLQ